MKKAIVIDDEVIISRAIIRRVEWKKYGIEQVFQAACMQDAMDILEKESIDLMLCDIEMPEGTGLDLFAWVKEYFPYIECIYITSHPNFDYVQKAMRLGSFDYILKPIDYEELDEVLVRVMKRVDENARVKEHVHQQARLRMGETGTAPESQREIAGQIRQYVRDHLGDKIKMEDIAAVVHLNTQYMMRLFRKEEGLSVVEYITNERIATAKSLLRETDYTVYQVAGVVGYDNYSYFTKVFKKVEGLTPREYKKQVTKK